MFVRTGSILSIVSLALLMAACAVPLDTAPAVTGPPSDSPTAEPTTAPPEEPPVPEETPPTDGTPLPPFDPVIGLELVAEGLVAPVALKPAGDGSARLFVVDQVGTIRILTPDGELMDEPFLDVRDRMVALNASYDERGLLGLAFHPDYAENGRFYVYYSAPRRAEAPAGWDHTSHVSEFRVSPDDPNRELPDSERVILQVDQPQSNHNAGQITFDPDGYLVIALGDGGGANDTGLGHSPNVGNGQDRTNLLGALLRIDVDQENGRPYAIPDDNPFVGEEGMDEILAYGFRNPYRFSFDAGGERWLIVGDVGQNLWEEVSLVTPGGNYGWRIREGTHCFDPQSPNDPPADCPDSVPYGEPLIDPVIEYANANVAEGIGLSVIGGYVYRGAAFPQLYGRYVFGDWSRSFARGDGALFVATPDAEGPMWPFEELRIDAGANGRLGQYLLSFGQDANLELYVLTSDTLGPSGRTGRVYRIVPPPP